MEFLHWPSNCKSLKFNCKMCILVWLENFTGKTFWVGFLEKYCTKALQACICLQSEIILGVIIFKYGGTGNFQDWINKNSFIKFNMVKSLAEVYNGKLVVHESLAGVSLVMVWLRLEEFKQMGSWRLTTWPSYFLLTMAKLLIYGVVCSPGLLMHIACISNICFLLVNRYRPIWGSFWVVHLDLHQCSIVYPRICLSLEKSLETIS